MIMVILLVLAAAVLLLVYAPGGPARLDGLLKAPDFAAVDFATLRKGPKPNQYLVLPAGLGVSAPDMRSADYAVSPVMLRAAWEKLVAAQPNIMLRHVSADGLQLDYVQRTATMRYPDLITVRFVARGETGSALAVYSRSVFGHSDLGVNARRITAWLAALDVR